MKMLAVWSLKRGIIDPPEPVDAPPIFYEDTHSLTRLTQERDGDFWRLSRERDPWGEVRWTA